MSLPPVLPQQGLLSAVQLGCGLSQLTWHVTVPLPAPAQQGVQHSAVSLASGAQAALSDSSGAEAPSATIHQQTLASVFLPSCLDAASFFSRGGGQAQDSELHPSPAGQARLRTSDLMCFSGTDSTLAGASLVLQVS